MGQSLSEHPPYADLGDTAFPNGDFWSRHSIYLPFGLALEPEDAEHMARGVLESGIPLLDIA
jgi:hypothetical protein